MVFLERVQARRDEILAIAVRCGAFNVRVFGSAVRGDDTADSDVDFLIDYDANRVTPWFPGGLLMDLQDLLGCRVDVLTEKGISPFIRDRVLEEARLL